jgi:hypothetical protein
MRCQMREEVNIQRAVFQHIRVRGVHGLIAWHTPNGGARNPIEAAILKGLGRPGVSDVVAVHDSKVFALELRSETGRPTEAQLEFIADIEKAGAFTAICYGTDSAVSRYDETGLIWGREVIALTADTAAIRWPSGSVNIYHKSKKPAFGPFGDSLDDFQ